jgi:hypothetical protein
VQLALTHKSYPNYWAFPPGRSSPYFNWHAAILKSGDLKPGDLVEFKIGTEKNPLKAPRRSKFEDRGMSIWHYIDIKGSGDYVRLANFPTLEVLAGEKKCLRAFLPSIVHPGDKPVVRSVVIDEYDNYVETPADTEVDCKGVWSPRLSLDGQEGVLRLDACSKKNAIQTVANPVVIKPASALKLYWGDLHFHCDFSHDVQMAGRENSAEDCYRYGRDVSGLDFACLTDHYEPVLETWKKQLDNGLGLSAEKWELSKDITDKFYSPGRFVTFFGYEYRTPRGDTCIYFRDKNTATLLPQEADTMRKIGARLSGVEYFSAPHLHTFSHGYLTLGPWKWGHEVLEQWQDFNPDPVIEVFSNHGRYEYFGNELRLPKNGMTEGNSVQAHLLRGNQFGIYANSDNHEGRPGLTGLTAVYAPELTREAIFDAIKKRRCYGTTNARIILDFHVNGHFMGERCVANDRAKISGEVHGTDKLEKVEIIRDGRVIHTVTPDSKDCQIEFEDTMVPPAGTCFYYLRVTQRDQHMAWSSPVWVDFEFSR